MHININQIENNVNNNYQNILQGIATNTLITVSDKHFKTDIYNSSPTITKNGIQIQIEKFSELKFSTNFYKVLDYIILKLTPQIPYKTTDTTKLAQNQYLTLSVSKFISTCGLSKANGTKAKEQLLNAIRILTKMHLTFTHTIKQGKKSQSEYLSFRICNAFEKRGKFIIQFHTDFLKYLSSSFIMPFNANLFKIDMRHYPNAYLIARRLLLHHNMNYTKSNKNIISVAKLIESVPTLPTHKDIMNSGKHVKQQIIEPFELNMTALCTEYDILSNWNYQNPNPKSYEEFIKSSIFFILKSYPVRDTHK